MRNFVLRLLLQVLPVTFALAVPIDSAASEKMYWTDFGTNKIQRADLDGSNVEDLVVNLEIPGSIALDVVNDKMYWTYFSNSSPPTGKFQQANLNGSEIKDLVPDSQAPHSLSLFLVD